MTTNSLRNIRILLCLFFCFRMTPFIYAGEFLFTTINASQGLSDNQIRYIPSRQLYFIDGFRKPNEGTSEKIGTSIFGLIWTTEHLNKHSVIWTMQIFCIVNI